MIYNSVLGAPPRYSEQTQQKPCKNADIHGLNLKNTNFKLALRRSDGI